MTLPASSSGMRSVRWAVALAVFVLAVIVRLAFLWEVKDLPTYRFLQSDELAAHQAGVACMENRLPRDAFLKAPVYVYFLGYIYKIVGPDPHRARIVQAVLCSLSASLVFLTAERVFGMAVGVVAGLLGAVFWMFVFFAVELVDASLASLFYLMLACTLTFADHRKSWHWAVAGVFLGLGSITRPNVLLFAPFLAVVLLILTIRKGREGDSGPSCAKVPGGASLYRRALINVVALTAGCCAIIAPITLRNRIVGGEWVLIAAYGGLNLWVGNNPDSDGKNVAYIVGDSTAEAAPIDPNDPWSDALGDRVARRFAEKTLGRPLKRGELDRFYRDAAIEYIRRQPGKFVADTLKRLCWLFSSYEFMTVRDPYFLCGFSRVLSVLSYLHFGIVCPLMVVGTVLVLLLRDRPAGLTYLLWMLGTMLLGGVLFIVNSRFRVPLVYLGAPLAAYGFVRLLSTCRRDVPWSSRLALVGLTGAVGVLSNWDFTGYRPPYHTDMRFAEAMVCWQANRADLAAEAAPRLEEALQADEARGCRTWTTLLVHSRPNTLLFACYATAKNAAKTLAYGRRMSFEVPFDPAMARPYFELLAKIEPMQGAGLADELIRSDRKEAAGYLLEVISPTLPEAITTQLHLAYARKFKDAESLRLTERILQRLSSQDPTRSSYREALQEVHGMMKVLGMPISTRPLPPGPSSREAPSDGR